MPVSRVGPDTISAVKIHTSTALNPHTQKIAPALTGAAHAKRLTIFF